MGFKEYKLEEVSLNYNQQRIPLSGMVRNKMKEKTYPYYGAQGIIDYVEDYIFDGRYLLIAEDGENLKSRNKDIALIAEGKFWVNNHAHIIKENESSNIYVLKELINIMDLEGYITGSAQPKLNKGNLNQIRLKLPEKRIQDKIGELILAFDSKINVNKQITYNLEQLVQTLFKRWFFDFEFPNENGDPYRSSGGEMVESELGIIPKSWDITQLEEIVIHSKKTFNPKQVEPQEVAHFSLPAFDQNEYSKIEDSGTIKSNKYYINENSLLFSKMNPNTPRIWLPNIIKNKPNICSTEFVVLNTSFKNNKSFVYSLISSKEFTAYLINNATGSTNSRQRVSPTTSIAYRFPYNDEIVSEYERQITSLLDKILVIREENQRMISLREILIPKLLSGEIELPDETEVTEHVPVS